MKQNYMMTMFAAAAMTVAAHAEGLNANVPFDFSVAGKKMSAGSYLVSMQGGVGAAKTFAIRNASTRTGALVVSTSSASSNPSAPSKLVFRCNSAGCSLAELHKTGAGAVAFATPRTKTGDNERTVAIQLTANSTAAGF